MKILVCPDSFKGTLTAPEAAEAIRSGVLDVLPQAEVVCLPVGDGGEGTVAALVPSLRDAKKIMCRSLDPLRRPITASYYISGETAFIESASASGLTLVESHERDVLRSDSYGTGLLIADAIRHGCTRLVIGMGGTATCDAGLGALEALLDKGAMESFVNAATRPSVRLLCDVDNPLCGPRGAAPMFGPQKGATPEVLPALEDRMRSALGDYRQMSIVENFPEDILSAPYGGAAGGLAAMLMAVVGATPSAGIDAVLEMLRFEKYLEGVDLVITGEGKADVTTLSGKAPMGILKAVRKHFRSLPVMLVAGKVEEHDKLKEAGFAYVVQATPAVRSADSTPASILRSSLSSIPFQSLQP